MASVAKTVVATGVSSGIGLEAIHQLLTRPQPYRILLGARDVARTKETYDKREYDRQANDVSILQLDLGDMKEVKAFARQALEKVGDGKIDYLLLNAGITNPAEEKNRFGSKWCESYIVNHLSQHYLVHLLREKLVESSSRIVFVSSGAVRNIKDTGTLESTVKAGLGEGGFAVYAATKFIQLLGANWWRRQLTGQCHVVAVSPGLIPGTNLGAGSGMTLTMDHPDAKSVPEGGANVLRALDRDDFPEDPEQIFLTSWGEWWSKDVYELSLDKALQDKWSPGKDEIEKEEGLV